MGPSHGSWRLGEILVQKGWLTWDQLEAALKEQQKTKKKVDTILLENGFLTSTESRSLCLGEILIKNGWLSWENLERGLEIQRENGSMLGEVLVKKGFVSNLNLYRGLAIQWGRPFVSFDKISIPASAIEAIPKHLVREYAIMPLLKKDGVLLIAVSNPHNINPELEIKKNVPDHEIRFVIAEPADLQAAILRYYGP